MLSDLDPVLSDISDAEFSAFLTLEKTTVPASKVPALIATELRRIYTEHGDPGLYFLIGRAQMLEEL